MPFSLLWNNNVTWTYSHSSINTKGIDRKEVENNNNFSPKHIFSYNEARNSMKKQLSWKYCSVCRSKVFTCYHLIYLIINQKASSVSTFNEKCFHHTQRVVNHFYWLSYTHFKYILINKIYKYIEVENHILN